MNLSKSIFMRPACSRRLTGAYAHVRTRMWVVYGRVPLFDGLPARASRQSAPDLHDGDHHAHRPILISGVGRAQDDRPDWPPNRHHQ